MKYSSSIIIELYHIFRKELENQPLMTKEMREMEKQAKILSALNQYPVTQLRIYFPDNYVIQASFKPHDTIKCVMEFLRQFLIQQDMEFCLSTYHIFYIYFNTVL